jgi:hypothetical protein
MFKKLGDLSVKRDWLGAIGFYLAYFFLGILIAMILGALFSNNSSGGLVLGQKMAIIYCPLIALLILRAKKSLNNIPLLIVALLSGVIAVFIGMLGGLIPTAYLTTVAGTKKTTKKK